MNFFSQENNSLHNEKEQLRRQKSALKLKTDSINHSEKTGFISGHFVTIDNCDCMDFIMRKKPCKHMYRLAEDLGIFEISSKTSDKNIVATDIYGEGTDEKRYFRNLIKDNIRNISKDAQLELQKFTSRPKKKIYKVNTNNFIDELINAGLLIKTNLTLRESIENLKVADIRKMCTQEKPQKNLNKNELIDFFIKNYSKEAEDFFSINGKDMVYIELSKDILDNLVSIHRFLCSLVGTPSDRYKY